MPGRRASSQGRRVRRRSRARGPGGAERSTRSAQRKQAVRVQGTALTASRPATHPAGSEHDGPATRPRPRHVRAAQVAGGGDAAGLAAAGWRPARMAPRAGPRLRCLRRYTSARVLVLQPARLGKRRAGRADTKPRSGAGGVLRVASDRVSLPGARGRLASPRPAPRLTNAGARAGGAPKHPDSMPPRAAHPRARPPSLVLGGTRHAHSQWIHEHRRRQPGAGTGFPVDRPRKAPGSGSASIP